MMGLDLEGAIPSFPAAIGYLEFGVVRKGGRALRHNYVGERHRCGGII